MLSLTSVLLLVAAIIHVLPVSGVLGGPRLQALYGVPVPDPNLELAMRHRAVLFGVLGGLLVVAAFQPAHRSVAVTTTLVSDLGFLALFALTPGTNSAMRRVMVADVVSIGCLLGAGALHLA